ncbi:hypothetical protein GBAR_LOCUS27571 [Geodia barretti]|uniref:Uncharacterized protein n=1 Tax=Geodia barretti TaxID=519541 RepID=A0AA35TLB5_GEOBA|nr:hypothetical protein GBAR_LOCUS27571 [Geodia barretti]
MDLFNTSGFPDCDVDTIIQTEMQYSNGTLDFQLDDAQYNGASGYHANDPTLTSVSLGPGKCTHATVPNGIGRMVTREKNNVRLFVLSPFPHRSHVQNHVLSPHHRNSDYYVFG